MMQVSYEKVLTNSVPAVGLDRKHVLFKLLGKERVGGEERRRRKTQCLTLEGSANVFTRVQER